MRVPNGNKLFLSNKGQKRRVLQNRKTRVSKRKLLRGRKKGETTRDNLDTQGQGVAGFQVNVAPGRKTVALPEFFRKNSPDLKVCLKYIVTESGKGRNLSNLKHLEEQAAAMSGYIPRGKSPGKHAWGVRFGTEQEKTKTASEG